MTLKHWEPATQTHAPHAQLEYVLGGMDQRRDSADVREVAFESVDRVDFLINLLIFCSFSAGWAV